MIIKTFCRKCNKYIESHTKLMNEEFILDGVKFNSEQYHIYCPYCGKELFPDSLMDINVRRGHSDYIKAKTKERV